MTHLPETELFYACNKCWEWLPTNVDNPKPPPVCPDCGHTIRPDHPPCHFAQRLVGQAISAVLQQEDERALNLIAQQGALEPTC